ncbi:hypothetical protein SLH49_07655 [Cognatiyoonia sp. IB215446]|uniref:hypothetical protein n=1 Tax=Cognatiyoonia sp. IB215446 TaxID=3097355 RepID=UPI002A11044C|nr:hypothetical protein [Cognatiyoonia sp. IB215446]MDX8347857.1 hypothetical protein [Cognatiyoonia sp. IB215446]
MPDFAMTAPAADTYIREDFRFRRVGGGLLVFIAIPLTLFWARFGLPLRYDFVDLLFILAGPGLLLAGLWAAFPRRAPRVRLIIGDEVLRIINRREETTIPLDDLRSIQRRHPGRQSQQRLSFNTDGNSIRFDVVHMTHEAADIINLVGIRLEKKGKHLREGRTDVLGAPNGIWEVRIGNPFEDEI